MTTSKLIIRGLSFMTNGYTPCKWDDQYQEWVPLEDAEDFTPGDDKIFVPDGNPGCSELQPEFERVPDDMGPEVLRDSWTVFADDIDRLIRSGAWRAGRLNGLLVRPDRSQWPERWLMLKTDLGS